MQQQNKSTIERTVLWYVILASLWAILLDLLPDRPGFLAFLEFYKGIGFVVFSGILIYILLLVGNRNASPNNPQRKSINYAKDNAGQKRLDIDSEGAACDASGNQAILIKAESTNTLAPIDEIYESAAAEATLQDPGMLNASAVDAMIERWARALELRNHDLEGHSERLIQLTIQLGRACGLPEADMTHIRRGTVLHDIGKITLPDSILLKNGLLNDAERQTMQKHPLEAYRLLSGLPFLERALEIPYCHHERWDGNGYPRGLKGEQIPLAARIFAVVEVWEAMTSDRPYRKALPKRAALIFIRSQKGLQFDPQVVDQFLQLEQIAAMRFESIDPEWELSLPVLSNQ